MSEPSKPPFATPYCLHCYAPLERFRGASCECATCGRPNLHVDQQRLWTRERRLRELESLAKSLILIAMGGVAALALMFPGSGVGKGHGMAIGAPILMGILLWDLASITRSESQFRGDIIWPIIGWGLGPLSLLVLHALSVQEGVGGPELSAALFLCVAVTVPAVFSPWIRRRWLRWRAEHIARRQALTAS